MTAQDVDELADQEALERAIQSLIGVETDDNDIADTEKRVVFVTTQSPSARMLEAMRAAAEEHRIAVTFVSLSTLFESRIVDEICSCRGCAYFGVRDASHFDSLRERFGAVAMHSMAHGVEVAVMDATTKRQSVVDAAFGSVPRQTLFEADDEFAEPQLSIFKLCEGAQSVCVEVRFEDRFGTAHLLRSKVLQMAGTEFDNGALRTAVVLSRYIEALRAWNAVDIADGDDENAEDGDGDALKVSALHKERFGELLAL